MASRKHKNFFKIVVLGDSGVGKTNLLQQYLNGKVTGQFKPTIGADFIKKEVVVDGVLVTLQIWDTAGQKKFQSLGYAFYKQADGCLLVYDMTNASSLENLTHWRKGFLDIAQPNDPASFPFALLGNKLDQQAMRQIPTAQGQTWAINNNKIPFFETSALESTNIEEVFRQIAAAAVKREASQQILVQNVISGLSAHLESNLQESNKDSVMRVIIQVDQPQSLQDQHQQEEECKYPNDRE